MVSQPLISTALYTCQVNERMCHTAHLCSPYRDLLSTSHLTDVPRVVECSESCYRSSALIRDTDHDDKIVMLYPSQGITPGADR